MSADSAAITLASERLRVTIARPGTVYTRTRFDWSGLITQITLDGRHTFCVPESADPARGTGGIGLCNEFNIHSPIGYENTAPGDRFPKLGVGLLTRSNEGPYRFTRPYEVELFPCVVEAEVCRAVFTVHPLACRGYAARLVKTIAVEGSDLTIDYELTNVGTKPLAINEYNHNFVAVDGRGPSGEYRLRIAAAALHGPAEPVGWAAPGVVTWLGVPEQSFSMRFADSPPGPAARWELHHLPTGCRMAEYGDFPSARLKLWGDSGVISPEVFIDLTIPPGERACWRRRYAFCRA